MTAPSFNPNEMYASIVGSPAYRRELTFDNPGSLTREQKKRAQRRALAMGALQCAKRAGQGERHSPLDADMYGLAAQFDSFMEAQIQLEELQVTPDVRREAKVPHLKEVVKFNHALRETIDKGGHSLTFSDIYSTLTQLYRATHDSQSANYFDNSLYICLVGMRHEIRFEQIVGTIDGLDYETATPKQEIYDGIDITLFYQNASIPVDIKSTQRGADQARAEARYFRNRKVVLWSGIELEEFAGGFRIPYELAVEKGKALRSLLEQYASTHKANAS